MDPDPHGMADYQLLGDGFGYHSYGSQSGPSGQNQQPGAPGTGPPGGPSNSMMNPMPGQAYHVPGPRYAPSDPSKGMLHGQYAPFSAAGQPPPPQMSAIGGPYPPDPRSFPGMADYSRPPLGPPSHLQMNASSSPASNSSPYSSRLMSGQFGEQRAPPGIAAPRASAPMHGMGGHQSYAGYPATSAPPGYGHPGSDVWAQNQNLSQRPPYPYSSAAVRSQGQVPGFPDQYNASMHQLQSRPYFAPPASQGPGSHHSDGYPQSGFSASSGPSSRSSSSSRSQQQQPPPQSQYPFPPASASSRYPAQYAPYGQSQPFPEAARLSPYGLPPGVGPNSPGYRQPFPGPAPLSSQMSPRRPTPTPPAGSPHQPPTSRTPDRVVSATTVSVSQSQPSYASTGANQLTSSSVVSPPSSSSSAATAPPSNSLAQLEQLVVSGSGLPLSAAPGPKNSSASAGSFYTPLPTGAPAPNVYSHFPSPSPGQHPQPQPPQQQQNYYYQQPGSSWPASQSGQLPPGGSSSSLPGSSPVSSAGFSSSMRSPQQPPASSSSSSGIAKSPLNSQFSAYDNSQFNSPASDTFPGAPASKSGDLTSLSSMQKFDTTSSFGSPVTPSQSQQKNSDQDSDAGKEERSKETETFAESRASPGSFYGSLRSSSVDNSSASSSAVPPDQSLNSHKKSADSINQQSSSQQGPAAGSSPGEMSYLTRAYQNDPAGQQTQYMSQQMYSQSQQPYSQQMSQFGSSYSSDPSLSFDMSSGMNDQPTMTQMSSYASHPDQRLYDQGYGQGHGQGMDSVMGLGPGPSSEYTGEMGDMGMGYQPSPYDETFSSEPPTKKKGKGRPKKDPAEPKKEKKPRQPRVPKTPRGRGRGGRANMGDRMPPPQSLSHEYGDSGGGYGMPGMPPDASDMFAPPPPHHHMHPHAPGPHGPHPHMSPAPHDPFRGPPPMIVPSAGVHHPPPGMCAPPPHIEANSFDGAGQPSVPVPVPSAVPPLLPPAQVPVPSSEVPALPLPPPPVETLLDSAQCAPAATSAPSPALPAAGSADAADPKRSDSQAIDSADGAKEPAAADDAVPPETTVSEDLFSQSASTSNDNSAFVLPSSEDSSSLLPPAIPQPDSPLFPAAQQSSPPAGSPLPALDSALPTAPDDEPAPTGVSTTKRKGKKRKSKQEKAAGGEEAPEQAKKTKRSAGGKKKKKVDDEVADVAEASAAAVTADLVAAATDTTIDTEASSIADLTDSAAGAFDEATQEGDADAVVESGSAAEGTPKGKKGKGKGTPKGGKKPKLKEGKSSAKKKLPKIALAKFKGRKKKRLGSSDHNSDIEKTPPPSPDETETGIQKRRSGRVIKRTKYLDEVDLDLSADESKKDDDKKEVATVIVDDTMVVEKIMCTRMGTRELEPENEEEEARFKQGKPPTVEVEEFYVKYKNLSYLHCDWRTEEELEKGDKRINQKIKRYKMKKDSNISYDFLDDEPFNPDYCEVDRILDVNIVTEEIPVVEPALPLAQELDKADPPVEATDGDDGCKTSADDPDPDLVKSPDNEIVGKNEDAAVPDQQTTKETEATDSTERPVTERAEATDRVEEATDEKPAAITKEEPAEEVKPKKTVTRTVRHYLVKWQALPYEESTWELEDDLDPEKVKQFWRFREMPPKDVMKHKKRPKPHEWKKLDHSHEFKSGNTLREYQLEGLNWLTFCWYNSRNCILADEMGLGKTIQSLTFINEMVNYGMYSPFLIIAPLSTIGNWQREFETWTDLNVITYHGSSASRNMITEYEMYFKNEKGEKIEGVYKFQVMITTFEVVLTDCLELREIVWRACVIDEAHRLKNRNCKLLEGLRLLQMEHRVLLTGTPLQNNVEELFSLLNFLEPVQFSSPESFMLDFGDLKTEEQVEKLQAILKPMMLRRLKEDVEKSLAPKEETIVEVELTNIQKKYYRAILERNFQFLSKGGTYANMPNLMNTMMELRKCCIHPFLINSAEEQISADYKQQYSNEPDSQLKCMVQASGKLVLIDKLLPRLRADGHRVLIFSQMVRCLDILEDYVIQKKYPYERIDGRVRGNMRQAAIDRFSKPGSDRFVFLLCTRAGGLGINLTAADTVIIFDSDWNPQNDLQAQARCHRIGQSKMVKVYRLICRNTYEREMFDKASLKLGLDKAVLQSMNTGQKGGTSGGDAGAPLSKKDVEELLRKGAYGAVMDDDNAGDKFCEEDIDQILTRRTQVITIESGEKGSTFSRASFATSDNADIELDDPNFWEKWAKKANIDSEEFVSKNELIQVEPRRRTQTKRFGQDDGVMEMSDAETSDDDEDNGPGRTRSGRGRSVRPGKKGKRGRGNGYERERDEDYLEDFRPGNWARAECEKVEKALLTYGWGRWEEFVAMGNFRRRLTTRDVEDIARVLLLYCLRNYKGDEKVKSFIFDLITPVDQVDKSAGKLPDSCSPTGRNRKNRKSSRTTVAEELTASDWASSDSYNPELLLPVQEDEQYRKRLSKLMNKLLLRVKLLYYLAHEIIGDLRDDVLRGVAAREIPIPQPIADGDPPSAWWDEECDKSLLIGVFKHGYDRYNLMRQDTSLCFFHRCGPPDGAALLAEIAESHNDDMGRLEEDEEPETPATPATQDSAKEEAADGEASGRLAFPSRADMNHRLRRIVAAYQKHSKRQETRMAQQAKHQQRLEKLERFEAAIRERELKKRETAQKKWSRREEADFYRVVSSYGVEFDRQSQQFEWNKFRTFSRLEKKVDETLTEYFKAFYAMCKRVTGRRLTDEEENLQISVDPISEERATRCLARIDLLSKIREEILPSPDLHVKLQICQPSIDLPDWWVCGKHDKDLLIGAAKYGLNRLDQSVMHDPDLSFRDILRNAEAEAKKLEEAAALLLLLKEEEEEEEDKTQGMANGTTEVPEKEEKSEMAVNGPSADPDSTRNDAKNNKEDEQESVSHDVHVKLETEDAGTVKDVTSEQEQKEDDVDRRPGIDSDEICAQKEEEAHESQKAAKEEIVTEKTSVGDDPESETNGISAPQADLTEDLVNGQTHAVVTGAMKTSTSDVTESATTLANGDLNGHHATGSPNAVCETEPGSVTEANNTSADMPQNVSETKSSDKNPETEIDSETKSKPTDSKSKSESDADVNEEIAKDEETISAGKVGEPVLSSLSPDAKVENAEEDRKPENLIASCCVKENENAKPQPVTPNASSVIPLPAKAVRWPKDRVLQMRLEQIVYSFEKNEWPSMRNTFFSTLTGPSQSTASIATADSSPSRAVSPGSLSSVSREPTPHPTPEQTPRRELSPLPDYLFDNAGDSARRRKRRRRRYDPETEKRAKLRNLLTQNLDQVQVPQQQHQFQHHQQPQQSHASHTSNKNKSSMSAAAQSAQSLLNHASSFLPPNFFSSLPFVSSLRSDLRNDFLSDEKTASLLLGSLSRPQAQAIASMTSAKHGHGASHSQSSPSPASGPPPAHQSSSKRNAPAESLDLRFRTNPMLVPPPAPAHKPSPKLPPLSKNRAASSAVPSVLDLSSGPSLPKRPSRASHHSHQPAPSPPPLPRPQQQQSSGGRSAKRIGSRLDAIALNLQAKKMMEKTDPKESNFLNEITTRKSEKRKQESSLDHLHQQLLQKKGSTPPAAHSGSSSSSKNLSSMSDLLGKSLGSGSMGFGSFFDTKAGQSKSSEASAILEQANAMKQNFNRWLESHPEFVQANPDLAAAAAAAMAFSPLSSSLPANTELLELPEGRRRGRRPRTETVSQPPADPPGPPLNLNFDETVPVVHRQTGKRIAGHKAPLLRNLSEWLEKNPGYEIDTKCSPLSSEKFSNFKVPVSTSQQSSAAGIRTRTSDRGSSRSTSSESPHAPNASGSGSSRRTTAASLLANAHAHGNHLNSTPTSGTSFGFPSSSLTPGLAGFNPNLLSNFSNNMNMKMFLDSMAAVSSTHSSSSSSSSKMSTAATSGASTSTTSSSSSQQNALNSFFPFAGLAGIAGQLNPLLSFPGLNFPGYPSLGSFGDDASAAQKAADSTKSSAKSAASKSAEKKAEKAKNSSGNAGQMFGSANSSLSSSAMPFLYPNPNFLYSGLGLGGFSGLSGSSPFASLTQSSLMNGLGSLSGSSSMSPSPKSGSRGKSSRNATGAPSGLSLSTASSLLSAPGIHPSSAAAAAAMGDSDDESLKSLMGHEDDDEDLNGDLDDVPSKDDSDSDYDTRPKRKTANKSKTDLSKGRKSGGSGKSSKS